MSEQPIVEVIDAEAVGAHSHPHEHPHDHEDIRGEIESIRGELGAAVMVQNAEQAAVASAVAAEAAVEEAYDAQADITALRAELQAAILELREGAAAPVIVDAPMPEPTEDAPPPVEDKPKTSKKKSGLSWF